jgi:hypothetical protein
MKACAGATCCQILPLLVLVCCSCGIGGCASWCVDCGMSFFLVVNPKYEKYDVFIEIKTFFIDEKEIT